MIVKPWQKPDKYEISQSFLDFEVNSKVQLTELNVPAAKNIKVDSGQKDVIIIASTPHL